MFCTIKFVYYKSFCVKDDIGSYIRTVYHMVSHTPKRQAGGSNPLGNAKKPDSIVESGFTLLFYPLQNTFSSVFAAVLSELFRK